MPNFVIVAVAVVLGVFIVIPAIVASFLRNVDAGTIRLVSWLHGGTVIYRGPGKSKEIPLLTTGTTSHGARHARNAGRRGAGVSGLGVPGVCRVRVASLRAMREAADCHNAESHCAGSE